MNEYEFMSRVSKSFLYLMSIDKKLLSKLLTGSLYRDTEMENIHHDYRIPDEAMKVLNKDICNRVYEFLCMISKGDITHIDRMFGNESPNIIEWDDPVNEHHYDVRKYDIREYIPYSEQYFNIMGYMPKEED